MGKGRNGRFIGDRLTAAHSWIMNLEIEWEKPVPLRKAPRKARKESGYIYKVDLTVLPNVPGIYVFARRWGKSYEALYVGQSMKIRRRVPVAPIVKIEMEDGRFISSYDVAETLDDSYNLAAMHCEDFEHLIREIFEKEFAQGGGVVKVTQASRDRGVDAIAFDPDPIRGGKIVIQAKRYTKTVGVTAVRDLYGTVMNEGATKGILITTSDYGPDAYDFVKDKPLTLLNGNNLLHLLEKHGTKARIDLKEAQQLLSELEE